MHIPSLKDHFQGFDRRVWILFYGRIMTATGFAMAVPFLAMFLHNDRGISMSYVGLILLFTSLVGSMGNIVGGEIADRYGRKRMMSVALIWRSLAFVSIAIAIATGQHYLIIAALITLSSFGGSLFDPASNAMIADVVEPSMRLEAYGLLRIGQNIGWAAGPMIGGLLTIWLPFSWLFLFGAVATMVVAFFLWRHIEESLKAGTKKERFRLRDLGHVKDDRVFMYCCLTSIFLFLMFGQMSSSYAVYSTEVVGISQAEVGYLWTWNGVMVIFLQMPISRWISKFRMSHVLAAGSLFYAVGYGMVGLTGNLGFWYLFLNMSIVTMGEMLVSPASMNVVASISPENERGRYMGVFGLTSSIGFSLGPFTGGVIMDTFYYQDVLMWSLIGMFGVMAAVGYLMLGRMLGDSKDRAFTKA